MAIDSLLSFLPQIFLMLVTGAAGGFLSGLFGVGGGAIFVPALYFAAPLLGWSYFVTMHMAIGTSFGIVLATAVTSTRNHHRRDAVDIAILKRWSPFIAAGITAGLLVAARAEAGFLKNVFVVLLLALSGYMAWPRHKHRRSAHLTSNTAQRVWCLLVGFLSSMTGIGGAILNLPFLTYLGLPIHRAIGTAAGLVIAAAIPGLIGYMIAGAISGMPLPALSLGYVNFPALLLIAPASVVAAPFGVRLTHRLPSRGLTLLFACFLLTSAVLMLAEK